MVIGGSSESGATTESHPASQPQIAVNPDAAPLPQRRVALTQIAGKRNIHASASFLRLRPIISRKCRHDRSALLDYAERPQDHDLP
jgi:hypothetical protein